MSFKVPGKLKVAPLYRKFPSLSWVQVSDFQGDQNAPCHVLGLHSLEGSGCALRLGPSRASVLSHVHGPKRAIQARSETNLPMDAHLHLGTQKLPGRGALRPLLARECDHYSRNTANFSFLCSVFTPRLSPSHLVAYKNPTYF